MSDPFLGTIRLVGFNFAPVGWALSQGQTLPISQNMALFSLIGTTFGGDGVQTFNLLTYAAAWPSGRAQDRVCHPMYRVRPAGKRGLRSLLSRRRRTVTR